MCHFDKEGGIFLNCLQTSHIHTHNTYTPEIQSQDISGARRLCVTFAREREGEKKKRRKITFFPGPSNVT